MRKVIREILSSVSFEKSLRGYDSQTITDYIGKDKVALRRYCCDYNKSVHSVNGRRGIFLRKQGILRRYIMFRTFIKGFIFGAIFRRLFKPILKLLLILAVLALILSWLGGAIG